MSQAAGRKAPVKPLILNPRHLSILEACWHYRFLTVLDVLYLLGFAEASLTHVRRLFAELCEGEDYALRGYLYRFPLPIPTAGPRVYTLGAPGRDLLESLGEPVDWHFRPHRVKHFSYAHVLHALLVTRLVCAAHAFVRTHQEFRLVESHLCYELAKTPAMVALPNTGEAPPLPVVPDALLVFAACEARGEEDLLPVLVEADRGREHRVSFTTHLRLRLELLRQQAYRHWLGGVEALRIAYVTTGERPEYRATRCQAMVKWASELLAELKKQEYGQCFYFTSVVWEELYAPPCRLFEAPVWYQPGAPETPVSLLAN